MSSSLASPRQTQAVLKEFGFRSVRDLGQNFLVDANVLEKIVSFADLKSEDVVLEVGTGIGTLTAALASRVKKVITVEFDERLEPIFTETLSGHGNIAVLRMDAMDLTEDLLKVDGHLPTKVVANLPYGVAAPLILKILAEFPSIKMMVVMVQREIADRICTAPGKKSYSAFTLKVGYFCRTEKQMSVSRHVFMPKPNVDSAVIGMYRHDRIPTKARRESLFNMITAGFQQRRKQLVNAIGESSLGINKDKVAEALESMGLSRKIRAERLTLEDFDKLTIKLVES